MHSISCSILETLSHSKMPLSPGFASSSLTFQPEIPFHYPPIIWCCQGWTENHCYMCSVGGYSASTLFYLGDMFANIDSPGLTTPPQSSHSYHTDCWTSPCPTSSTQSPNLNSSPMFHCFSCNLFS